MLSTNRAYASGAGGVLVSQGVSAVAGVVSLWLLARILTTDQLAGYVVAMSVLILVGYNAGLAIERAMLLRLAELPVAPGVLAGRGLMLRTLAVVLCLAVLALVCVVVYAQGAGDAGRWLMQMSPLIPAITIGVTLTVWFQANHRVGTSAIMQGLTDGGRCLFFAAVFLAGLGPSAVAYAAVLAAALPIFALSSLAWGKSVHAPSDLRLRDIGAGFQFLVMRVSQMGLRQLDIIIVGMFATGLETAQYAIAARISALASVGHLAFSSTYMPRVRHHLATADQEAIKREFHGARLLAFVMTLLAAITFYVFGSFALGVFGNFTGGYPALLLLMAAQLLNASYGLQTEHLAMSGHLHVAAVIRGLTTFVFVIALLILVPGYSSVGAGVSALIAAVVFSVSGAWALRWRGGPAVLSVRLTGAAIASTCAMIAGALIPQVWGAALAVLCLCLIATLTAERSLLWRIARDLRPS
ncbi:lipopolysaccharide biosynthesis protein [Roseobacter sinensis]|uniref:Polysaccharide biosynthesis protein n=1 Tax=Roseobacter sinensis TaxID=2931391 RepID=A0ABT3BJ69_9RHOB|nr:hypothetical protein [Roseobacter sp. WL0113]MCV3273399.1 hypothetical protein [Roseobacter sp. WL0113]